MSADVVAVWLSPRGYRELVGSLAPGDAVTIGRIEVRADPYMPEGHVLLKRQDGSFAVIRPEES